MKILGFLGSPRVNGKCSKLLKKALEGAESRGADTKRYDLINCNIKHCTGCGTCFTKKPELLIGKCSLEDDMVSILEEYIKADGYIFASPVYDMFITALMKKFLERKIILTCRIKDEPIGLPSARSPANFKKMASMIVTGNAGDEYREVMGDPCFEAMEVHLLIEQVPTVDRFFVGGVEWVTDETFSEKLNEVCQLGIRLVAEIEKAQKEG